MKRGSSLWIDYTHIGRRKTGIERVTRELFNAGVLTGISLRYLKSPVGRVFVLAAQMFVIPLTALFRPKDVFLFPGYPPSPFMALARERCIFYVHDLFLLTRRSDLNLAGKLYLAPLFAFAVKRLKYFFVNSEKTGHTVRAVCRADAQIMLCRPQIRNVFNLFVSDRCKRSPEPTILRIAAIGTVEPRKNFMAAANICVSLARERGCRVELNIIGRRGWGGDWDKLKKCPGVILHGVLSDTEAGKVIDAADVFICSSHDEGLGLPLLEVQYGGLPTVAPDQDVFREVLGDSGIYIDPNSPDRAARTILKACATNDWRLRQAAAAFANLQRWNKLAVEDQRKTLIFLGDVPTQQADVNWGCGLFDE